MKKNILVLVVVVFVMSACAVPAAADINQTEGDFSQGIRPFSIISLTSLYPSTKMMRLKFQGL